MTTRNRELASIIDDSGNITTGGNLSVTGNLTQSSSTTTTYSDGLLELNNGAGSNSNDLGLVMERGSTGDNAIFLWDESNDGFAVGTTTATGSATGNISFSAAPFTASTITGTILNGSTSVRTPLIEYTDGDDALTIADGGLVTTSTHFSIGGSNNELRFYEGSNYVGFEAPALSADQIWVLPAADGSSGQLLKTDGSGNLSFTDDLTLANASVNNFSGDGSTTGFTLSSTPVTENTTMAYINGVYQFKNTYSVSGTTFTFDTAPANGASIEIIVWSTVAVNTPADSSVTSAKLSGNLTAPGTLTSTGVLTANAGVVVDNITIDGTEIDLSSGDLTIDVASSITLDSDSGVIDFDDGGTNIGRFENASSDFKMESRVQDKDIVLVGNDGGTGIEALRLDMSEGGRASFITDKVHIGSSHADAYLYGGAEGDEYGGSSNNNASWIRFSDNTSNNAIMANCGHASGGHRWEVTGTEYFRIAAGQIDVKSADLTMQDSRNLYFGAGNDLRIYHDGSDSYIKDQGTGNLVISSSDTYFMDMSTVRFLFDDTTIQIADAGTNAATIKTGAGDELYVGGDDNDGYFRIKTDGNTQVMSPSNFWVNLGGSDRYGFDTVRIYPAVNNTYDLGLSSHRWREVFGVTSNFSSDARLKTELTPLTDNEIKASKLLAKEIGTYKWLDQVASEGDKAKINIGLTAQKIIEVMKSCSLDALDYKLVTFSEWDATEAKTEKRLGEDGKIEEYTIDATPAGDEYGVCYEQLNQFIAVGFNARLEALEG